jgi:hypothetical protein
MKRFSIHLAALSTGHGKQSRGRARGELEGVEGNILVASSNIAAGTDGLRLEGAGPIMHA